MSKSIERIALPSMSPGSQRFLDVHRYRNGDSGRKAYVQAALHADETPGMLVAHHLLGLLDEADRRGEITGEILLVPACNPIGLAQVVNGSHSGRYELRGGGNFNRGWPDLFDGLLEAVRGDLGQDARDNVAVVRRAIGARLDSMNADNELDALKLALTRLAYDADLVLDLHCAEESLLHLYMTPAHWPDFRDLAAYLGARAVLLCAESGGASFDEALSTPWLKLAAAVSADTPIPAACFSATVELRGQADVCDRLAAGDAEALYRFLQHRGMLAGAAPAPGATPCEATDLDAADYQRAPAAGLLSYRAVLGETVHKDQLLAEIIDPLCADPATARTPVRAVTDGLLLSRRLGKLVAPGVPVAMVVGREKLAHREGRLLAD